MFEEIVIDMCVFLGNIYNLYFHRTPCIVVTGPHSLNSQDIKHDGMHA